MKIRCRIGTGMLIIILLLAGCTKRSSPVPAEGRPIHQVRAAAAKEQQIPPVITSFGSISFTRKIDITAAVGGTVKHVSVDVGDTVGKGRLLAELSDIQLEIREKKATGALAEAEAALDLLRTELWRGKLQVERDLLSIKKLEQSLAKQERQLAVLKTNLEDKKLLFEVDGITEKKLEEMELAVFSAETDYSNAVTELAIRRIGFRREDIVSRGYRFPAHKEERTAVFREAGTETLASKVKAGKARVKAAEEDLESVRLLLGELEVTAPAAGIIGSRAVEEGERVPADARLFSLLSGREVYALFPVSEDDLLRLTPGMKTEVEVPAIGARRLFGTVKRISPTVDPSTGNIQVKAELTNPEGHLKPGMYARVTVYAGEPENIVTVPRQAVIGIETGGRVFIIVNGRAYTRRVSTGREMESDVEITEGIEAGDIVVDSPSMIIRDGDRVHIKEEDDDGITQGKE